MKSYVDPKSRALEGAASVENVQRKSPLRGLDFDAQQAALQPVQARDGALGGKPDAVRQAAADGVRGQGGALPHLDRIGAAFGGHDVSGVSAHVGGAAARASQDIGASAYATGESVAFAEAPDLHTAAHEAAHVVQQRQGTQLSGGVGKAGDTYERQADAVADRVVAGRPADDLLGPAAAGAKASGDVQRMLPDAQQYHDRAENNPMLQQLGDAVTAYNTIAGAHGPEGFQSRFNRLQAVERLCYRFLSQVSQNQTLLSGNQDSALVKELLSQTEREHQELVSLSKDIDEVLPFDTSNLQGEQQGELRTLWQDIVKSRANIKISGSEGYQRRVLAELAKILSTTTGQRMLKFLNTPSLDNEGAPIAISQIFIGESLQALPEEIRQASPLLAEKDHSEAQPLGMTGVNTKEDVHEARRTNITGPEDRPSPETHPEVDHGTIGNHFDSVVGGKRGFTHGDHKYDFTQGTGSFVTSNPGEALNGNAQGHEIHTPGWVTLGHELGHAANMKAGATTIAEKGGIQDFPNNLAGGEEQGAQWDNAEELLVIKNVENGLRRESGQEERHGHRSPAWIITAAQQLKDQTVRPLLLLSQQDPTWPADPAWRELRSRILNIPAQTCATNPGVMAPLREEVQNFVRRQRDQHLPGYLNELSSDQVKGATLLASLSEPERTTAFSFLHKERQRFPAIRRRLHVKFLGRILTNERERMEQRVQTLKDIVNGVTPL